MKKTKFFIFACFFLAFGASVTSCEKSNDVVIEFEEEIAEVEQDDEINNNFEMGQPKKKRKKR